MFVAKLICACGEERTAEAATIAELDSIACDCGCALEIAGWPDWTEEPLAVRFRRESLPRAA